MRKILFGAVVAALLASGAARAADGFCEEIISRFGPFDYRKGQTTLAYELNLVDSTHFTSNIENGIKGRSGTLGGELDYTLHAFPNHTRALASLDRLSLKNKNVTILPGMTLPVECFFERAVRFAPDDGEARAAYATYLFQRGKTDAAMKMFVEAERLSPDDPRINYNLGLMYAKAKDYEKANRFAQKAYRLGFPLPGLKNQLVAAGKWRPEAAEPAPAVPAAPATAATEASAEAGR